jgi:hypothetical protein
MTRHLIVLSCICVSAMFAQYDPLPLEVSHKNVSFSFEQSVAKKYTVDEVAASPADTSDESAPAHLVFSLDDSYVRGRDHVSDIEAVPRIFVVPVASAGDNAFLSRYPHLKRTVDDLRQILGRRIASGKVPLYPVAGSKEGFVLRRKPLRFRNGKGIGFITQFTGPTEPPANDRLIYAFVGLTDDYRWLVTVIFPIEALGLPGRGSEAVIEQSLESYMHDMLDRIERLQPRTFYPSLTSVEKVVRSIKVASP